MAQLVRFVAKMVAVGVFGGPDCDPDGISARKCVKTQKMIFLWKTHTNWRRIFGHF